MRREHLREECERAAQGRAAGQALAAAAGAAMRQSRASYRASRVTRGRWEAWWRLWSGLRNAPPDERVVALCCHCGRARRGDAPWEAIPALVSASLQAGGLRCLVTHGVCSSCVRRHYPEYAAE